MFACCSRDVTSSRVEITNEAKSIASTANGILSYEHSDVPMSSTNDASENHELPIVDDGGDGVVDCEDDDDDDDDDDGNEGGGYGDGGGDDGDDDDDDNDVDDDDDEDDNEGGGDGDGGGDDGDDDDDDNDVDDDDDEDDNEGGGDGDGGDGDDDGGDDGGGVTDKEVFPSSSSEHVNNSWKNLANFMKKHNLTDSAGDELIKLLGEHNPKDALPSSIYKLKKAYSLNVDVVKYCFAMELHNLNHTRHCGEVQGTEYAEKMNSCR